MGVSEWIKEIRKDNNLSQSELGDIIFVSQNTISNYEKGLRGVDLEKISQLAKKFNYEVYIGVGGFKAMKVKEETVTMCECCMRVIENKQHDGVCPYCKEKGHIVTGTIKLPKGVKLLKRNKEVVLCESLEDAYTPYKVWILSAPNEYEDGIKYGVVYGRYFDDKNNAEECYKNRVEEYSHDYYNKK